MRKILSYVDDTNIYDLFPEAKGHTPEHICPNCGAIDSFELGGKFNYKGSCSKAVKYRCKECGSVGLAWHTLQSGLLLADEVLQFSQSDCVAIKPGPLTSTYKKTHKKNAKNIQSHSV